jgi:hypothetical protein
VYLITNAARRAAASGTGGPASLDQWMNMTPEQRQQSAQEQAARMLSMDPAARGQVLMQQAMVFGSMMQQMSPEQRQQMMQGMQQFFRGMDLGGGGR